MSLVNSLTNSFNSLGDPLARKEQRDRILFDLAQNKFTSPYGDMEYHGVILMIESQEPAATGGTTAPVAAPAAGNPTHPWVITARIRPLAPMIEAQALEEPCKFKADPKKLYENLMQHPIAYSETIDGDESTFIPTVGDVVPIYYDMEGPKSAGKKRGLRFKLKRIRRATGGFDVDCMTALGAKMADGKVTLSNLGTPGGTMGGGGFAQAGFGQAVGGGGTSGLAVRAGAVTQYWPSGIVGVEVGQEGSIKPPSKNAWNTALAQRSKWMDPSFNPSYPVCHVGMNGFETIKVTKPNLLTLLDATMTYKVKNLWTYDLSTSPPTLLVYAFGGVGFSNYGAGAPSGMHGNSSRGVPVDFANGNSHTSAGMKIFGRFRSFHSQSQKNGAIQIRGLTAWNGNEQQRGAIGHETGGYGKRTARARSRSAGCISTAWLVNYTAREIWKGGSFVYVWTGHTDESIANNNWWIGLQGRPYHKYEKRTTWNWSQPRGGHQPMNQRGTKPYGEK